jgi:DNA-directed RNA polymerase subunit N (RpoN/RPB10)
MDPEFPVVCLSGGCRKVINTLYPAYVLYTQNGLTGSEALDKLRVRKACCRTRFLTHVPKLGQGYAEDPHVIREDSGSGEIVPIDESSIGKIDRSDKIYDD